MDVVTSLLGMMVLNAEVNINMPPWCSSWVSLAWKTVFMVFSVDPICKLVLVQGGCINIRHDLSFETS